MGGTRRHRRTSALPGGSDPTPRAVVATSLGAGRDIDVRGATGARAAPRGPDPGRAARPGVRGRAGAGAPARRSPGRPASWPVRATPFVATSLTLTSRTVDRPWIGIDGQDDRGHGVLVAAVVTDSPAHRAGAAGRRPDRGDRRRTRSPTPRRFARRSTPPRSARRSSLTVMRSGEAHALAVWLEPEPDEHLDRPGSGVVPRSGSARAAGPADGHGHDDRDHCGHRSHGAERELLLALRGEHRPPLRLGAFDVGLLVGHVRCPTLVTQADRWRRASRGRRRAGARAGSVLVGTASARRASVRRASSAAAPAAAPRPTPVPSPPRSSHRGPRCTHRRAVWSPPARPRDARSSRWRNCDGGSSSSMPLAHAGRQRSHDAGRAVGREGEDRPQHGDRPARHRRAPRIDQLLHLGELLGEGEVTGPQRSRLGQRNRVVRPGAVDHRRREHHEVGDPGGVGLGEGVLGEPHRVGPPARQPIVVAGRQVDQHLRRWPRRRRPPAARRASRHRRSTGPRPAAPVPSPLQSPTSSLGGL